MCGCTSSNVWVTRSKRIFLNVTCVWMCVLSRRKKRRRKNRQLDDGGSRREILFTKDTRRLRRPNVRFRDCISRHRGIVPDRWRAENRGWSRFAHGRFSRYEQSCHRRDGNRRKMKKQTEKWIRSNVKFSFLYSATRTEFLRRNNNTTSRKINTQ